MNAAETPLTPSLTPSHGAGMATGRMTGFGLLRVLLAKDLRRTWRNPLPLLINLLIPLAVTALIGLVFGGKPAGAQGRIRFALVDEDQTILTDFLRGAANQRLGARHLEPVIMDRAEALRQINANRISAIVIIPANFTRDYFAGREDVELELIKNPAQSMHPAVMEELLGVVVTGLNAVSRNLQSEFPDWQMLFDGKGDYKQAAALIERAGDKLKLVRKFIDPPLVHYERDAPVQPGRHSPETAASTGGVPRKSDPASGVFTYLLTGMSAMFLLFLASNAMTDLHREVRLRTLARYHNLHQQLTLFVASKVGFAVVVLAVCSAILLAGGGLIFGIVWQRPGALAALALGYAFFAAGLMATLVALIPDERKANALNTVVSMGLALAGGCMFPPQGLPAFLRDHLTPLLPTYWFVDTARTLQYSDGSVAWIPALVKLIVLSVGLLALAALLFRRQLKTGARA